MTNKKFLAPILALAAIGLPARASVAVYCDNGCGASNIAAFNSIVLTNMLTYAYGVDQTFTGSLTSGNTQYTDGLTNLAFQDANMFTITGSSGLETVGTNDTIVLTIPSLYLAVRITLLAGNTNNASTCFNAGCDGGPISLSTPTTVGYYNNTPGSSWTIQLSTLTPDRIIISSLNAAGPPTTGSDTPEVGTLLLIGFGLIAMRWVPRAPRLIFRTPRIV